MNVINVENIKDQPSTVYEEDSYTFLQYYQYAQDWIVYDSDALGIKTTCFLIDHFSAFHGKILFPDKEIIDDSFWSSIPLGIFRFKLLEDMSCGLATKINKVPGYIVEGSYWNNGFYYLVRDADQIIQAKLFIDQYTKTVRDYPDPSKL